LLSPACTFRVNPAGNGQGFVESLSASQRPGLEDKGAWYQGTADAVRRYLDRLDDYKHESCEDVLILSGDQL
jgi:glucose-1-phosphate adenylyltransferase